MTEWGSRPRRKKRKIGRYILLAVFLIVLYGELKNRSRPVLPELPERVSKSAVIQSISAYPAVKKRFVSARRDRIYLTYGRTIIFGDGNLSLKLSVADSIISANHSFRVLDFRHDGWAILRR